MRRAVLAAFALVLLSAAQAEPTAPLSDAIKQQRYDTLVHQLMCLQCTGETVADTPAKFAVDIRRQVREMVEAGKTEAEVRQYMVERYDERILMKPLWSRRNAWLWLAPGIFMLAGFYVAWRILRQRRELLASDTSEVIDEAGRS